VSHTDRQSIFVSTNCIPGLQPIISRVSMYQSNGLNAIELGGGITVSDNSLSQITQTEARFLIHNYFPPPRDAFVLNLASDNNDILRRSLDMVSKAIDFAVHIGAPFYSVHAGFITDPEFFDGSSFVFPSPRSPDQADHAVSRFTNSMKTVVDYAERRGIGIFIENNMCSEQLRGKLLLQTAEEFLSLFSVLQSSHLGLLLDTGHINVSAHTLGFDRMSFIDKMAPFIKAMHIHDNNGIADMHQPIRPDSWVLDILRRPEFGALPLIIEAKFENMAELCRHVEWLRNEIQRK
jgi:sugar phosphate isomerase/epimerase